MPKKSLYTKKLGAIVAGGLKISRSGRYHVIAVDAQKWSVVPEGSVRPVKAFHSQKEAIDFAKQTASKKTGEVFIHSKDGQLSSSISYAKK